jgi:hypothetical protein
MGDMLTCMSNESDNKARFMLGKMYIETAIKSSTHFKGKIENSDESRTKWHDDNDKLGTEVFDA